MNERDSLLTYLRQAMALLYDAESATRLGEWQDVERATAKALSLLHDVNAAAAQAGRAREKTP